MKIFSLLLFVYVSETTSLCFLSNKDLHWPESRLGRPIIENYVLDGKIGADLNDGINTFS